MLTVKGSCAGGCEKKLQMMMHVHAALNKEQDRLQRVLVSYADSLSAGKTALQALQSGFPATIVAMVSTDIQGMPGTAYSESMGRKRSTFLTRSAIS